MFWAPVSIGLWEGLGVRGPVLILWHWICYLHALRGCGLQGCVAQPLLPALQRRGPAPLVGLAEPLMHGDTLHRLRCTRIYLLVKSVCNSSIFLRFGVLPFPASASRGNICKCAKSSFSPLFVLIRSTRRSCGAGRCSAMGVTSWATSSCMQDPMQTAVVLGGSLFYKILAPILLCLTCFGDKEKLKTLPQPLTG